MACIQEWLCSGGQRLFLVCLSVVCFVLVGIQYRFNFTSTTKCFDDNRYVKRLVERVYYEVPLTTKAATSTAALNRPSESTQKKEELTLQASTQGTHRQRCTPETYIMFLKTHKTGSSTITNLLNRYADKFNLSILLPVGPGYYSFDWPNKFRLSSAMPVYSGRPNFLANHARYSRKSLDFLFPRKSTKYISILRHPVSQWESTFQYMSFPYVLSIMSMDDPMAFFLDNLPTTENIVEVARRYPSAYLIRNPLFFDLGLDYSDYENSTMIRRAVHSLDQEFDLVLIMEHFDESLTLLRRRLCWDIDDVVYFKMNERLSKHKRRVLSLDQIQKIKRWNNADMVLYNYFVEKFWREIQKEGEAFYDDVQALRERRNYYANLCIERDAIEEAYSSVFVKGYKMRANLSTSDAVFCERMLRNEIRYQDYFRAKNTNWLNSLEGATIENFKDATIEAEVFVDSTKLAYSVYEYGAEAAARRQAKSSVVHDEIPLGRKRRKSVGRNYSAVEGNANVIAPAVKSSTEHGSSAKSKGSGADDIATTLVTSTKSPSRDRDMLVATSSAKESSSELPYSSPDDSKRYDGKSIVRTARLSHKR